MRRVGPDKWASAGLAAAVLKLKWHFLSEAFRQTALFCPFTRNLRDTQTPITKYKSGHLKHRAVIGETDCGFNAGQRFMVRTHQLMEISLKMRNRFPRRFRGSCTKETARSPKKSCAPSFYSVARRNMPLISHISMTQKRNGIADFNFLPQIKRNIDSDQMEFALLYRWFLNRLLKSLWDSLNPLAKKSLFLHWVYVNATRF